MIDKDSFKELINALKNNALHLKKRAALHYKSKLPYDIFRVYHFLEHDLNELFNNQGKSEVINSILLLENGIVTMNMRNNSTLKISVQIIKDCKHHLNHQFILDQEALGEVVEMSQEFKWHLAFQILWSVKSTDTVLYYDIQKLLIIAKRMMTYFEYLVNGIKSFEVSIFWEYRKRGEGYFRKNTYYWIDSEIENPDLLLVNNEVSGKSFQILNSSKENQLMYNHIVASNYNLIPEYDYEVSFRQKDHNLDTVQIFEFFENLSKRSFLNKMLPQKKETFHVIKSWSSQNMPVFIGELPPSQIKSRLYFISTHSIDQIVWESNRDEISDFNDYYTSRDFYKRNYYGEVDVPYYPSKSDFKKVEGGKDDLPF